MVEKLLYLFLPIKSTLVRAAVPVFFNFKEQL